MRLPLAELASEKLIVQDLPEAKLGRLNPRRVLTFLDPFVRETLAQWAAG